MTRFPAAPSIVFYDFACGAARFALSRELNYFKRTRFVIDKLHWSNHIRCSPSFSPYANEFLTRGVNTSICEQQNALYKPMKKQLYFFAQEMYLFHLRLAVLLRFNGLRKDKKLKALRQEHTAARRLQHRGAAVRCVAGPGYDGDHGDNTSEEDAQCIEPEDVVRVSGARSASESDQEDVF